MPTLLKILIGGMAYLTVVLMVARFMALGTRLPIRVRGTDETPDCQGPDHGGDLRGRRGRGRRGAPLEDLND